MCRRRVLYNINGKLFSKIYALFFLKGEMKVRIAPGCIQHPSSAPSPYTLLTEASVDRSEVTGLIPREMGGRIKVV